MFELYHEYPWLYFAEAAFTVWMLIDAYRRPAEYFWFWVILLFQPIGPWIYFFVVKLPDFTGGGHGSGWQPSGGGWLANLFHRRPSIEELRYQAEHVPTLANSLALAERLVERNEHEEALPHLESALAREPDHCQVLFLHALCHAELNRPEKAVPELEKVIARDRGWSDYSAWRLLVRARSAMQDAPGALTTCRELARIAPTLRHRCLLAEHLIADGQSAEARDLLQRALEDYRFAPSGVRRLNRQWAGQAKRLLKQASAANV
jgi:hypothetical protein